MTRPRHIPALVLASVLLPGCMTCARIFHSDVVESVSSAVGTELAVVAPYPCEVLDASSANALQQSRMADGWGTDELRLTATAPLTARVQCQDGVHLYRFATVARLTLDGPRQLATDQKTRVVAHAFDADGGELRLGRIASDRWETAGTLRSAGGGGCEFPPWCDHAPAGAVDVSGGAPGPGEVTVRVGAVEARFAIVSVAPDAGR